MEKSVLLSEKSKIKARVTDIGSRSGDWQWCSVFGNTRPSVLHTLTCDKPAMVAFRAQAQVHWTASGTCDGLGFQYR